MSVDYEWVVEMVDEHGDIMDPLFFDHIDEAVFQFAAPLPDGVHHFDFGLKRDVGNNDDGLQDRQYVYLTDEGKLPDTFEDGATVPQRFRSAINRRMLRPMKPRKQ